MKDVFSALLCPACHKAGLQPQKGGLGCAFCESSFQSVAGVQCLFPDGEARRVQWGQSIGGLMSVLEAALGRLASDLGRFDLLPLTRQRLTGLKQGFEANRETLGALLNEAGLSAQSLPEANLERERGSLTEHYDLVLRDWAWETGENQRALDAVLAALSGVRRPKRIAVLGAGGCRLAYDLHQTLRPDFTVALDNNPLLLLLAHRVLFSSDVNLYDFPLVARSVADSVKQHQLKRPGDVPENFYLLLADGLRPPFTPGAFDLIVTPWFIDIVGEDIRNQIATYHSLLEEGGLWLNHGPLIHSDNQSARLRYVPDEVLELVRLSGFELTHSASEFGPHLVNAGSSHARLENVHTFSASKRPLSAHDDGEATPAWVVLPHLPVPEFQGLDAFRNTSNQAKPGAPAAHPAIRRALHLIDGQRCLDQIAQVLLAEKYIPDGFPAREAAGALLLSVYQTSRALSART